MTSIPTISPPAMPEIIQQAKEIHYSFREYYYTNPYCIVNELIVPNYGVLLYDNILFWKVVDKHDPSEFKQANHQNIHEFFKRFINERLFITNNILATLMDAKSKLEEIYVPNYKIDTFLTRSEKRKIEISYKHYEAELRIWEVFICEHNALCSIISTMHGHVVLEWEYSKKYLKEKIKKFNRNKKRHENWMQSVFVEMEFAWDAINRHKDIDVWVDELEKLFPFEKRFRPFLKSPICTKNKDETIVC